MEAGATCEELWGSGTAYGIIIESGALEDGGWIDAVLESGDTIRSRAWKGPFTTCLEADASMARDKLHFIHNT